MLVQANGFGKSSWNVLDFTAVISLHTFQRGERSCSGLVARACNGMLLLPKGRMPNTFLKGDHLCCIKGSSAAVMRRTAVVDASHNWTAPLLDCALNRLRMFNLHVAV